MKRLGLLVSILLVFSMLAACGGEPTSPPPTEAPTKAAAVDPTDPPEPTATKEPATEVPATEAATEEPAEATDAPAEAAPTEVPTEAPEPMATEEPTAVPEPEGPPEGGKLVYGLPYEMDTLDHHLSGRVFPICQYFSAGLITKDPETGEFLPYLAESWEISEDGMEYTFKLREDVTFHDGSPLTAHDYAWSFNRAKDPKTKSPTAGSSLTGLAIVEALDDYTLHFRMAWPNSVLLHTLSGPCYHGPIPQAYFEQVGDDFGRNPVGVGPFKFKEWVTGERIVLERNPDYTWGPEYTHGGPPYIETIEFRILPEYATALAGLEAGEVDFLTLEAKDLERIKESGEFNIVETGQRGSGTHIVMNPTNPPFDDILLRQAMNHAVLRDPLVKIVRQNQAVPIYGPLTPFTDGYWPEVESLGYQYDMEKAKALLAEAGYTPGSDGMMEKDGQPLVVNLKVSSNTPDDVKSAEILQQQFKALGVEIEIEQLESGVLYETLQGDDYDMTIETLGWENFGIMFAMFHASMVGAWNRAKVTDMNGMIDAMVAAPNWDAAVEASNVAQKHVIDMAYLVPLYAGISSDALSNRVEGYMTSTEGRLYLHDAYINPDAP